MKTTPFEGIRVDAEGRIRDRVTLPRADVRANVKALPDGWRIIAGHHDLSAEEWYFPAGCKPIARPMLVEQSDIDLRGDGEDVFGLALDPATYVALRTRDERGRPAHEQIDVSDGTFEFVTAVPGLYEVDIEPPFPTRPVRLKITAHAV